LRYHTPNQGLKFFSANHPSLATPSGKAILADTSIKTAAVRWATGKPRSALPAANQAPQHVHVVRISTNQLHSVLTETVLCGHKGRFGNNRGYGNLNPLIGWSHSHNRLAVVTGLHWPTSLALIKISDTGVYGTGQNSANGRFGPHSAPPGPDISRVQLRGDLSR
jgi:hypothetical protein